MSRCPTCFNPIEFPRSVAIRRADGALLGHAEQCVDPSHDEAVLGRHGADTEFLRRAIKSWRGTTRQASVRMYHTPVPPVLRDTPPLPPAKSE